MGCLKQLEPKFLLASCLSMSFLLSKLVYYSSELGSLVSDLSLASCLFAIFGKTKKSLESDLFFLCDSELSDLSFSI